MRKGILGGLLLFLARAGWLLGQPPSLPANAGDSPDSAPVVEAREVPHKHVPNTGAETSAGEQAEAAEECEGGRERFWVRGEYLLWWIRNSDMPPLITTGAATDARPGALGMPGTKILFGGQQEDNKERSGGRFFAGLWLDGERRFGVEGGYFFLGSRSIGLTATSSGNPGSQVLARPFFDVLANREDASLVAFPGLSGGGVAAYAFSRLQGAEASGTFRAYAGHSGHLDLLAGFRWLQLSESVQVSENDQVTAGAPVLAGAAVRVADAIGTHNNFYGAQVGFRAEVRFERLYAELVGKVALGDSHLEGDAAGATSIALPGAPPTVFNRGLLALPSNSGRFTSDTFAVAPEVNLNVGLRFTEQLRGFVGYTFLYWSNVTRPGNQIDRGLNLTQVPTSQLFGAAAGPARPVFPLATTDFWAQGLSFGLEVRY
jgi:hypothetical protein